MFLTTSSTIERCFDERVSFCYQFTNSTEVSKPWASGFLEQIQSYCQKVGGMVFILSGTFSDESYTEDGENMGILHSTE